MALNDELYRDYVKKYATQRKITEEEAEKHALVREVKKYYDQDHHPLPYEAGTSVPVECGDCR